MKTLREKRTIVNPDTCFNLSPEEKRAIAALQRLEKNWPKTLWLFCNGHSISILRTGPDGVRVMNAAGTPDQDYIVESVTIPSDGGSW